VSALTAPRLEGVVGLEDGRRIGFAEFGDPGGRAIVWLHGTPGARRQIPQEARLFAAAHGVRLVSLDRPGIGLSSPHVYPRVRDVGPDLTAVADALGIEEMAVVGLSGGGPFALAAGVVLGARVRAIGVLGGVAPTQGPEAVDGGLVSVGVRLAPVLRWGRVPLGVALALVLRTVRPLASPAVDIYARLSPEGDRRLLGRPEIKAMFIDDLFRGRLRQFEGPVADVIAFTNDWGFLASEVQAPVVWWHGDADHIIPFAHGVHMTTLLPRAELRIMRGESHLGGLGIVEEILTSLLQVWDTAGPGHLRAVRTADDSDQADQTDHAGSGS
jgi:pimeloyl-ACP methyl ester carboxylesterase